MTTLLSSVLFISPYVREKNKEGVNNDEKNLLILPLFTLRHHCPVTGECRP